MLFHNKLSDLVGEKKRCSVFCLFVFFLIKAIEMVAYKCTTKAHAWIVSQADGITLLYSTTLLFQNKVNPIATLIL